MMRTSLSAIILLVACGIVPGRGSSPLASAETAEGRDDNIIEMPDVTGKTQADAEKALRAAGITGTINVDDNYTCDNPDVTELHVCTTHPVAGAKTRKTLPLTLHLRPPGTANYKMPDVIGMTPDDAKAAIMKLKQIEQRLKIEEMDVLMPDCQPGRVCRQDPKAGTMTSERDYKTLRIAPAE